MLVQLYLHLEPQTKMHNLGSWIAIDYANIHHVHVLKCKWPKWHPNETRNLIRYRTQPLTKQDRGMFTQYRITDASCGLIWLNRTLSWWHLFANPLTQTPMILLGREHFRGIHNNLHKLYQIRWAMLSSWIMIYFPIHSSKHIPIARMKYCSQKNSRI